MLEAEIEEAIGTDDLERLGGEAVFARTEKGTKRGNWGRGLDGRFENTTMVQSVKAAERKRVNCEK